MDSTARRDAGNRSLRTGTRRSRPRTVQGSGTVAARLADAESGRHRSALHHRRRSNGRSSRRWCGARLLARGADRWRNGHGCARRAACAARAQPCRRRRASTHGERRSHGTLRSRLCPSIGRASQEDMRDRKHVANAMHACMEAGSRREWRGCFGSIAPPT